MTEEEKSRLCYVIIDIPGKMYVSGICGLGERELKEAFNNLKHFLEMCGAEWYELKGNVKFIKCIDIGDPELN